MEMIQKQIQYWRTTAERDFETAQVLYKSKRYDACLFFCHLAIEKNLKGLLTEKTGEPAPYMHNLSHLAEMVQLSISKEQMADLATITTFNIAGRYDNIKQDFYKKCTPEYTKKHLDKTKQLYLWLEKHKQEKSQKK